MDLNQRFELSVQDPNNLKIIKTVITKFRNYWQKQGCKAYLPELEELMHLGHIALFKALKKHDPSRLKTSKFTTFLFTITWQTFDKEMKFRLKGKTFLPFKRAKNPPLSQENSVEIVDNMDFYINSLQNMDEEDRAILKMRFADNMTLNQIGQQVNLSAEGVRKRIQKKLVLLKQNI